MDQQEQYEQIEAYLERALGPEQIQEFERMLQEDPDLAREVALHRKLHQVMQPSGVNTFRAILEEEAASLKATTKVRFIGRRRILSIAASVAVMALAAAWLFGGRATTSQALYDQLYQVPTLTLDASTVRGEDERDVPQEIVDLFANVDQLNQRGDYNLALQAIYDSSVSIPDDLRSEVLLRQALLYLNLKQPEEAIAHLDQISGRQETVRWYKSLALLSLNRLDEIPDLLEPMTQYDNPRRRDAKRLLGKLDRIN